jgi:hypothetical protein
VVIGCAGWGDRGGNPASVIGSIAEAIHIAELAERLAMNGRG